MKGSYLLLFFEGVMVSNKNQQEDTSPAATELKYKYKRYKDTNNQYLIKEDDRIVVYFMRDGTTIT